MIREYNLQKKFKLSIAMRIFRRRRQKKNIRRRKKVSLYRLKYLGFNFVWSAYYLRRIKKIFLEKSINFFFFRTLSLQPQLFFKNAAKIFFYFIPTDIFFYNFYIYENIFDTYSSFFTFKKLIFLIKKNLISFFFKFFFLKFFFFKVKRLINITNDQFL